MARRLKAPAGILVGLVFLALTTSVWAQEPTSAPLPAPASQSVVTKDISPAKQQAALAFWSRQAIAAAKPLALPTQLGAPAVAPRAQAEPEVSGPPGFVAAGAAAPGAEQAARAAFPLDWAVLDEAAAAEAELLAQPNGTPGVYTSYIANLLAPMQTIYPHRWIGRLSFTTPAGTSYCSATSISGNVMVTAAHCLYDSTNNTWYNNWVFSPAYRGVAAPTTPFGTFPATSCTVLGAWVNLTGNYAINTWAPHDVGVCNMGTNAAGTTLNNAVGWMGRQWNAPYVRHFHDLGYPFRDFNLALLPNAGQYLRTCVAESFQQAAEVRGMGCNLGPGISGGPWMVNYAPGVVSGAASGVNSGLFVGAQNMYGPRFNDNNIVVLCNAVGC